MSFLFNSGILSSGGHVPPSEPRSFSISGGCQANLQIPVYGLSWLHPITVPKWDGNSVPTLTTDLTYSAAIYTASNNLLVNNITSGISVTATGASLTNGTQGINLGAGTQYYFRVTASAYGFSTVGQSATFTAVTFPGNVGTITVSTSSGQVALSWAAVNNGGSSVNYQIQIFTSAGSLFSTDNTSNTSFTKTGLTNGTTYYARVTAYNTCGQSTASQSSNFTPTAAPVTPPIIAVTPPIIAVTPPIIAVTPPPIIAVTPPIIAVTPPIIAVTPPIIAVTPPIIAVTPPIIAVTPPIIAVTPPIIAVTPPIIAVTPPIIATPPCTGCVRDECWYPCPPCCSICGC